MAVSKPLLHCEVKNIFKNKKELILLYLNKNILGLVRYCTNGLTHKNGAENAIINVKSRISIKRL